MPCFYVPNLDSSYQQIEITGDEYHHLAHVLRKEPGKEILLTNGKGLLAKAQIVHIDNKHIKVKTSMLLPQKLSTPKLAVAFALLKNKHDNLIVEKLTELGVKEFFPITTERTVRKPSKNTISRFKKTAIAATKQCDNAYLPEVKPVTTFPELLDKLQIEEYKILTALETDAEKSLRTCLQDAEAKRYCLVIGPEGGFSPEEITRIGEQKISTFSLGNHIIRAETAAISCVSQFLAYQLEQDPDYY